MEHEGDSNISCNWSTWNNPQRLSKGIGRFRSRKKSRDPQDYIIIKVGQNIEKCRGDLRKIAGVKNS